MKGLLESRQKALSAALDRAASSDRVLAAAQDALRSRREERDGNEGGTLGGSHRPRDAWLGVGRSLAVGDRCVLAVDHASAGEPVERVGVVAFIGPTALGEGDWVRVALDTPTGKHDGRVRGVRYFECALRHGLLVRQAKLRRYEELAGAKGTTLQPRSPNEKIVNHGKAAPPPAAKGVVDGIRALVQRCGALESESRAVLEAGESAKSGRRLVERKLRESERRRAR